MAVEDRSQSKRLRQPGTWATPATERLKSGERGEDESSCYKALTKESEPGRGADHPGHKDLRVLLAEHVVNSSAAYRLERTPLEVRDEIVLRHFVDNQELAKEILVRWLKADTASSYSEKSGTERGERTSHRYGFAFYISSTSDHFRTERNGFWTERPSPIPLRQAMFRACVSLVIRSIRRSCARYR